MSANSLSSLRLLGYGRCSSDKQDKSVPQQIEWINSYIAKHGHTLLAPVFADERFFAVRDLARLALGRVAHEAGRFDDARYYYYLVPRDSDRLAEARASKTGRSFST